MVPTFLVVVTMAMLYWLPIRRWMSRWGTTPSDLTLSIRSAFLPWLLRLGTKKNSCPVLRAAAWRSAGGQAA